ncbi:alpha/beta hydrolase family protein [Bacillus fonticola]|uniref:esterase n=1 Tax=Bacillus fonticola TaxID=2728853 RepID=UPI001474258B|nr:esterase [Bacillus fonticola]
MIQVDDRLINGIPVLEVVSSSIAEEMLPTFVFFHGVTSAREHNLHVAYHAANQGYRVILPDALAHGVRETETLTNEYIGKHFWRIVLTSIAELKQLRAVYIDEGRSKEDHWLVGGTSMGAITTLGALTQYKWISAAASFMGSPSYVDFANGLLNSIGRENIGIAQKEIDAMLQKLDGYDLTRHPEKQEDRPLFFWHGSNDQVVPIQYAKTYHTSHPEHTVWIEEADTGHKVSRTGLMAFLQWNQQVLPI